MARSEGRAEIRTANGATVIMDVPACCTQGPRCVIRLNNDTADIPAGGVARKFGTLQCFECGGRPDRVTAGSRRIARELYKWYRNVRKHL